MFCCYHKSFILGVLVLYAVLVHSAAIVWASVVLKFPCTSSFWSRAEKTGAAEYFILFHFVRRHTNHSSTSEGKCLYIFSPFLSLTFFYFRMSLFYLVLSFSPQIIFFVTLFLTKIVFFFHFIAVNSKLKVWVFYFPSDSFILISFFLLHLGHHPSRWHAGRRRHWVGSYPLFFNVLSRPIWSNALETIFNIWNFYHVISLIMMRFFFFNSHTDTYFENILWPEFLLVSVDFSRALTLFRNSYCSQPLLLLFSIIHKH